MTRTDIFIKICKERDRQHSLWGIQNHKMIPGNMKDRFEKLANKYKKSSVKKVAKKKLTWYDVLLEEIYEAFSEEDVQRQKEEFIQAASVIVQILENMH